MARWSAKEYDTLYYTVIHQIGDDQTQYNGGRCTINVKLEQFLDKLVYTHGFIYIYMYVDNYKDISCYITHIYIYTCICIYIYIYI